MKCSFCGVFMPDEASICPLCGKKRPQPAPPAEYPTPQPDLSQNEEFRKK